MGSKYFVKHVVLVRVFRDKKQDQWTHPVTNQAEIGSLSRRLSPANEGCSTYSNLHKLSNLLISKWRDQPAQ